MGLDQLATALFAVLITSVAYGISVCLFTQSILTMCRKRRSTGQVSWALAIPSILIFLFASVNVFAIWANFYWAILVYPEGPHAYLALVRDPCKTAIQTGQEGAIMLADLLIVYRTFVLWGGNYYVIIVPCITFIATFISGVMFVHLQHIVPDASTSIFNAAITAWTISFLLCSFATTLYSTSLIGYTLWKTDKNVRMTGSVSARPSVGHRIMIIFVESAAIYSTMHLLYAILYLAKSNIEATPSYLEASVASITCSLIIIRCEAVSREQQVSGRSFHFGPRMEGWQSTFDSGGGRRGSAMISDDTVIDVSPFALKEIKEDSR
ncbi:hypothetical protein HWV62_11207 [Athelia sp. TMB]|nr:hypothetical protein HWV62_11207 [Athelia sp. TMB]